MGMLEDMLGKALPGGSISKPLLIALGGLLLSGALSRKSTPAPDARQVPAPQNAPGGSLGGALAGGALGGGLLAGLGGLIDMFTKGGQKSAIDSWVSKGPNQQVSAGDLGSVLGPDILGKLQQQTGMGQGDLLSQLRHVLPELINGMTPQGRMPTPEEIEEDRQGPRQGPGGILEDLSKMSTSLGR